MKESTEPKPLKSAKKPWVDIDDIKVLMDLIKETEVSELEIEKGGVRVRIKKSATPTVSGLRKIQDNVSATLTAQSAVQSSAHQGYEAGEDKYYTVTSPIVGTFYRASSPDKEPYVNVGDVVKKGQILCIVEAMKLMNEIESEMDGKIAEVLVQDSQPVEYSEALFKIDPVS